MNSDFRKMVIYKVWSDQNLSFQIKIAQRWISEMEISICNINQYMIMLDFEHMTVTNEIMTFMKKMLPNWRLWSSSLHHTLSLKLENWGHTSKQWLFAFPLSVFTVIIGPICILNYDNTRCRVLNLQNQKTFCLKVKFF